MPTETSLKSPFNLTTPMATDLTSNSLLTSSLCSNRLLQTDSLKLRIPVGLNLGSYEMKNPILDAKPLNKRPLPMENKVNLVASHLENRLVPLESHSAHLPSSKHLQSDRLLHAETFHRPVDIVPKSIVDLSGIAIVESHKKAKLEPRQIPTDSFDDFDIEICIPEDIQVATEENFISDIVETNAERKKLANQVKTTKREFVNLVSASLISSPNYKNPSDECRVALLQKAEAVAAIDAEFILKVALYTRMNLNIRTTSNFLIAFAAKTPACRPYLKKFFKASIRLPSDWIEVTEHYESLAQQDGKKKARVAFPTALRHVMVEKFGDFDEYQLAKHNKQKKTNKRKQKGGKPVKEVKVKRAKTDSESSGEENPQPVHQGSGKLTLKKLIRTFHISKPAEFVMSIIGKRYPSDPLSFMRSGLPGIWDENRAGKRMKLTVPETWETQISTLGNKATVWESLMDHKKLPFMAMLRNLRNMIKAGISDKHHDSVIRRLKDEKSVINSRQFPFRFFSAYQVLDELRDDLKKRAEKESQKSAAKPRVAAKKAKGKKTTEKNWWDIKRYKQKLKQEAKYDEKLLERYQKALDTSVKIATTHNVQPIPGRSVVLCNVGDSDMSTPCTSAKGLGKPRTAKEIAVLLSLMCKHSAEDAFCYIYTPKGIKEAEVTKGTILNNMSTVLEQSTELNNSSSKSNKSSIEVTLEKFLVDRKRIDNLIVITNLTGTEDQIIRKFLLKYRQIVNDQLLYVNISLSAIRAGVNSKLPEGEVMDIAGLFDDSNDQNAEISPPSAVQNDSDNDRNVYLSGYSDQILRYVAERGNSGQLTFVDNIDKAYVLEQKATKSNDQSLKTSTKHQLIQQIPKCIARKSLRVFISSTFKDMYGERDVLARFVMPELKRQVLTTYDLNLEYVDLRWGLSNEQSGATSNVELCLKEVKKSQLFVGLLGERYGYVPPNYNVSDPTEFPWLSDYPTGRSMTELEIETFVNHNDDPMAKLRCFFYLRDKSFEAKIPPQWREDMCSEDSESLSKLNALKKRLRQSGVKLLENYSCEWGGIRDEKPFVAGLTAFAQSVMNDIWLAVSSYQQDTKVGEILAENDVDMAESLNWAFAMEESQKFGGRKKLITQALAYLKKCPGGILHLMGTSGSGKSSVSAKLAVESSKCAVVIPSFAHIQPGLTSLSSILSHLVNGLATQFPELDIDANSNSVELQAFNEIVSTVSSKSRLIFILDGYNNGVINPLIESKYLPNVTFVITTVEGSPTADCANRRQPATHLIRLGGLDLSDRPEITKKLLSASVKQLGESAFDNQLRLLTSKRDAEKPAYLQIACEYLRVLGDYEKLSAMIRSMPSALPNLVRAVVDHLEKDFGESLVHNTLIFLVLCEGQFNRQEIYHLVDLAERIQPPEWNPTEVAANPPQLPYSTYLLLINGLSAVLKEVDSGEAEPNVQFVYQSVADMVKAKLLKQAKLEQNYLRIICAYLGNQLDYRAVKTYSRKLPPLLVKYLAKIGKWEWLQQTICSLNFVQNCFSLNVMDDITPYFQLCISQLRLTKKKNQSHDECVYVDWMVENLEDFEHFVNENSSLLAKYPTLTAQQAYNQPVLSSIGMYRDDVKLVRWENRPEHKSNCYRSLKLSGKELTCVAVDIGQTYLAVGTSGAQVLLFDFATGREIFSFVGHSQSVSSVCFLDAKGLYLCSAGSDGNIFVWNTKELSKFATLTGHSGVVSCCQPFKWSKVANVITGGWDKYLRSWNFFTGKQIEEIQTDSPINVLDMHPDTQYVVTGHWDSTVKIYCLAPVARKAVLRGHNSSIRSVAYSKDGNYVISACMDGEIRMWSAKFGAQLGLITGHCLPVREMSFLADGNSFATVSEDTSVKVWASNLGQPVALIEPPAEAEVKVTSVQLAPMGKSVIVAYSDNQICTYNVETQLEERRISFNSAIVAVRNFGAAAKQLALVATSGSASIVSLKTGKIELNLQPGRTSISSVDAGGDYVATGHTDGGVQIYDVTAARWRDQKLVAPSAVVYGHDGPVNGCAFNAFSMQLATVGMDKTLNIWPVGSLLSGETSEPSRQLKFCHSDPITSVSWSHAKNLLITGSLDCTVKIWKDLEKNEDVSSEPLATLTHPSAVVAVDIKFGCVVTTAKDGYVRVWSSKGVLVTQLRDDSKSPACCSLYFEREEDEINWASEAEEMSGEKAKKERISSQLTSQHLSNVLVAVGFTEGITRVWSPFRGNELTTLQSHTSPVWGVSGTADKRLVTCSTDGCLKWWNLANKSSPHKKCHSGPINAMVVTTVDNSAVLYTGGQDGRIGCWYNGNSLPISFAWDAHSKSVSSLAANDYILVSGGEDNRVCLWTVDLMTEKATSLGECVFDSPVSCVSFKGSAVISVGLWSGCLHEGVVKKSNEKNIKWTLANGSKRLNDWIKAIVQFGDAALLATSKEIYMGAPPNFATSVISVDPSVTISSFAKVHKGHMVGLSNGETRLYDTEFRLVSAVKAHQSKVVAIVEVDSHHFLTASVDRTVKIWKQFESKAKLVLLWECPVAIASVAVKREKLWVGDSLGQLYLCQLDGLSN